VATVWLPGVTTSDVIVRAEDALVTMIVPLEETTEPSEAVASAVMIAWPTPVLVTNPVELTCAMDGSLDCQVTEVVRFCVAGLPLL
jgi:hypothetical protein